MEFENKYYSVTIMPFVSDVGLKFGKNIYEHCFKYHEKVGGLCILIDAYIGKL